MTSKREKFFCQRVLSKLFPSEVESDSDGEDNEEDWVEPRHERTQNEILHDVVYSGQKRKREKDPARPQSSLNPRQDEQSFPVFSAADCCPPCTLDPGSKADGSNAASATAPRSGVSARGCEKETRCESTGPSDQGPHLTKNQKRKLKKKRHKERSQSNGTQQARPKQNEFTYETG